MFRGSRGSLKPRLIKAKEGEAPYELYNMDEDLEETNNLYFENPEIVEDLVQKFNEIIKNGRSTPGTLQDYIKENWNQLSWLMN